VDALLSRKEGWFGADERDLQVAGVGEECGFKICVRGIDGSEKLIGLRLGNHGGLECAHSDGARRDDIAEARQTFSVKERSALVRRAGEEHHELAEARECDVKPL